MSPRHVSAPDADEYPPFYAGYVALVRERDVLGVLQRQLPVLRATCAGMTDEEGLVRYLPEKWSIKQVVGHLSDVERVMSYRLFRISRGDPTPLSGFDENDYVKAGGYDERPVRSLLVELESARASTLRLVETIPAGAWANRGAANGLPVSARALLFIIAGHVEHHFGLLRERYALAIPHIESPPA